MPKLKSKSTRTRRKERQARYQQIRALQVNDERTRTTEHVSENDSVAPSTHTDNVQQDPVQPGCSHWDEKRNSASLRKAQSEKDRYHNDVEFRKKK